MPEADQWAEVCRQTCENYKIPYQQINLNLDSKTNIESSARTARYAALEKLLEPNDCLLTAHHQTDQAETVLLQLLRGAGPKGLSAMPEYKAFGEGTLCRPLLKFTRKQLEQIAAENKLDYITDPSNIDIKFDRNFIRHKIFPILAEKFPGIEKTLYRVSKNCSETQELLQELAESDLKFCGAESNTLFISKLSQLSYLRQLNLLKNWLSILKFPLPNKKKLNEILNQFLHAREDAQPLVEWEGTQIRRYRDKLYILTPITKKPRTTAGKTQKKKYQALGIPPWERV